MRRLTILTLLALGCATAAGAQNSPEDLFLRAAAQYDAGLFYEAIDLYDSLLLGGYANAAVYFNIGNAYFRAGDVGRAIWAYRAGENMAPRDPDIEANLTVARLAARDRIEVIQPGFLKQVWRTLGDLLSLGEGARLVTTTWFTLWIAVAFWLLSTRTRRWLGPVIRWVGLVWAVAFLVLAARYLETRNAEAAVIVAGETSALSGPGAEFDSVFNGHSGLECMVRGRKHDYMLVELANGRVGWVPATDLALIPS